MMKVFRSEDLTFHETLCGSWKIEAAVFAGVVTFQ
jgi:hypothetical protein